MGRRAAAVAASGNNNNNINLPAVTRIANNGAVPSSPVHVTRSIGKRKRAIALGTDETDGPASKLACTNSDCWQAANSRGHCNGQGIHVNEDSSSNEAMLPQLVNPSNKLANNASILLNRSVLNASVCSSGGPDPINSSALTTDGSPKLVYTLHPSMVYGTVLSDLAKKSWRLGEPIGKGNFGEIFVASDECKKPVTKDSAKYVVKIEPHSNGPLFVEIHCLMNASKNDLIAENHIEDCAYKAQEIPSKAEKLCPYPPSGIPAYIASGSHSFDNARYRFLVLPRFDRDLHSLIRKSRVTDSCLLKLAIHILTVLENLHDRGYCHNDVKAQNLMLSKCKYLKPQAIRAGNSESTKLCKCEDRTDSGHSTEHDEEHFKLSKKGLNGKRKNFGCMSNGGVNFENDATNSSSNCSDVGALVTPVTCRSGRAFKRVTKSVQFSGSNPVRSCRNKKSDAGNYDEYTNWHNLRPAKRVSYSEFFNEDGASKDDSKDIGTQAEPNEDDDNSSGEFRPYKKSNRRVQSAKCRKSQGQAAPSRRGNKNPTKKKLTFSDDTPDKKNCKGNRKSDSSILVQTQASLAKSTSPKTSIQQKIVEEERIFLIDFGLASKYADNGVHRPFIMDQRRAHDGTLEFTSRDAHLGAHSRRSDLECLGYNLIFWSQGFLPWRDAAAQLQHEKVHRSKELLMTNVREMLQKIYGKDVPKYLGEFLYSIDQLAYQERPDYERYRNMFKREYERLGYDGTKLQLSSGEIRSTSVRFKAELHDNFCFDILGMINNPTIPGSVQITDGFYTPQRDKTIPSRISPKNLRSKSDKKAVKSEFCWAAVLAQDPDQIARERAAKEFEREEAEMPERPTYKYQGNPTYAILKILERRHANDAHNHNQTTFVEHSMRLSTKELSGETTKKIDEGLSPSEEDEEEQQEENEEEELESVVEPEPSDNEESASITDEENLDDEEEAESNLDDSDGTEAGEELDTDSTDATDATASSVKSLPNKLTTPKGCVVAFSTRTRNCDYAPKSSKSSHASRSTANNVLNNEMQPHHSTPNINGSSKRRTATRHYPRDAPTNEMTDDSNSNHGDSSILSVSTVWNKFDKFSDYVKNSPISRNTKKRTSPKKKK